MEISLRTPYNTIAELTIEVGNTKITEDVATSNGCKISNGLIESFITIAREMQSFNNVSDVDFVLEIFDNFLNDSEQVQFLEIVKERSVKNG